MRFKIVGFLFAWLGFGTIFFSSCFFNEPRYCKDFNDLSLSERKETVRKNSIETNFALIRCHYYTEGGPTIADDPIIEGGQASVPFLLSKLNESKDENVQYEAIILLSSIDSRVNLLNREEVMANIEQVVSEMKNDLTRKYSAGWLQDMKDKGTGKPMWREGWLKQ